MTKPELIRSILTKLSYSTDSRGYMMPVGPDGEPDTTEAIHPDDAQ